MVVPVDPFDDRDLQLLVALGELAKLIERFECEACRCVHGAPVSATVQVQAS